MVSLLKVDRLVCVVVRCLPLVMVRRLRNFLRIWVHRLRWQQTALACYFCGLHLVGRSLLVEAVLKRRLERLSGRMVVLRRGLLAVRLLGVVLWQVVHVLLLLRCIYVELSHSLV